MWAKPFIPPPPRTRAMRFGFPAAGRRKAFIRVGSLWKRRAIAETATAKSCPCLALPPSRIEVPPTMPPPPQAAATDSRLIRAVGTWALAASIINVTIGGGIFRLPGGVYKTLGQASPLAYLVCAAVIGLIVVCFAEAGSRVAQTGGLYAYIEVAFGPLVGFIAGVLLWAGMTAALSAVAVFFGDAVAALTPGLAGMKSILIAGVLALFAGLNVLGVSAATRFNVVMTIAKLAPLA